MLESITSEKTIFDKFKASLSSKQAWRFILALSLGAVALICLVIACKVDDKDSDVLFYGFCAAFVAGLFFLYTWHQCNRHVTVSEALTQDPRPPILYLRPFKADHVRFSTLSFYVSWLRVLLWPPALQALTGLALPRLRRQRGEELIVEYLEVFGPVVAIGRPGERVPTLGAARIYVGDEWKEVVHDFMTRSQMLLLFAGTTPNFGWELDKVFKHEPFVPTLLVLPFFRSYRQSVVNSFLELLHHASGLYPRTDLRKTRAIFFPQRDRFVELSDLGTVDERVLNAQNPFLGPITQMMELSRPGWSLPFVEAAKKEQRSNRLVLLICIPFLIFNVLLIGAKAITARRSPNGTSISSSKQETRLELLESRFTENTRLELQDLLEAQDSPHAHLRVLSLSIDFDGGEVYEKTKTVTYVGTAQVACNGQQRTVVLKIATKDGERSLVLSSETIKSLKACHL